MSLIELIPLILIGMATCIMASIEILIGKIVGQFLGRRAELLGGVVLVFIGFWIFISHFINSFF